MLALSSGNARGSGEPGACTSTTCSTFGQGSPPAGFPESTDGCTLQPTVHDDVALNVTLRAPTNASALRFDWRFFSTDTPSTFQCGFLDQFVVLDGVGNNLVRDANGHSISAASPLVTVCDGCIDGADDLAGTAFPSGAATSWQTSDVSVTPGTTLTLRFAIWDTGDGQQDSTVLLDNARWVTE